MHESVEDITPESMTIREAMTYLGGTRPEVTVLAGLTVLKTIEKDGVKRVLKSSADRLLKLGGIKAKWVQDTIKKFGRKPRISSRARERARRAVQYIQQHGPLAVRSIENDLP